MTADHRPSAQFPRPTFDEAGATRCEVGFSGRRTSDLVGITYRQLDYWARTDLVRPSHIDATGSGSRRVYSIDDLFHLSVIADLLRSGMKLEQVRNVSAQVRDCGDGIVLVGADAVTVADDMAAVVDALRAARGPLQVIDLDAVRTRLNDRIAEHQRRQEPHHV